MAGTFSDLGLVSTVEDASIEDAVGEAISAVVGLDEEADDTYPMLELSL